MKNVSKIETVSNGKRSWRLLDPYGKPIPAFDGFALSLEKGSPNTLKNYCQWLAEFFDYLYEAAKTLAGNNNGELSEDLLIGVLAAYDEYLVLGEFSGNEIALKVNATLPSPRISTTSSATKHAALRKFLRLSERVRNQALQLASLQNDSPGVSTEKLLPKLGTQRELSVQERQAMVAKSMIAGVVSGGPKLIEEAVLPVSAPAKDYDQDRAFPFDKVGDVMSHLLTHRDRALYAFCAASGCRISEALQLLWDDVDAVNQKAVLIDPKHRPHHPSYLALKPVERGTLVWKGRATKLTLLIEPFASMFFTALELYLKHEYVPHGRHRFIFQYEEGGIAGKPYFLAAASSRNGVLQRAVKLAGIELTHGPHSLRHMYGTYLLNYFPRPNGQFGLPIGLVQKLMGHAAIKDTQKYARYDQDLVAAELAYANQMVYSAGESKPLAELKRQALLSRLAFVEAELAASV